MRQGWETCFIFRVNAPGLDKASAWYLPEDRHEEIEGADIAAAMARVIDDLIHSGWQVSSSNIGHDYELVTLTRLKASC